MHISFFSGWKIILLNLIFQLFNYDITPLEKTVLLLLNILITRSIRKTTINKQNIIYINKKHYKIKKKREQNREKMS